MQCADDRLHLFNNSCYLFVSYPEVTWHTAFQICHGLHANLASVLTPEEERFVTTNIRRLPEYRTGAVYWLGARSELDDDFHWTDAQPMQYLGWLPGQKPKNADEAGCLAIQWTVSPTPMLPSGLYWRSKRCSTVGGYVCKRPSLISGVEINFNKTVDGPSGNLTTPNFPGNYYNNLDFSVKISGPDRTRLLITFSKIDIEFQLECLYDYIELTSVDRSGKEIADTVKLCGSHDVDMDRFNFVSDTNEALLRFHSDYSISGSGFLLNWRAVDTSGCPKQTFTAKEGTITSPNYPFFLLPRMDCSLTILAPAGKRVWLEFVQYDLGQGSDNEITDYNDEAIVELTLGAKSEPFRPFKTGGLLTDGTFVSSGEYLRIDLRTRDNPKGTGYKIMYKTLKTVEEEKIIKLDNSTNGMLLHLNYPDRPANNINFRQHFVAPVGHTISLELRVRLAETNCSKDDGILEIHDKYADTNGTFWHFCFPTEENPLLPAVPTAITSFLNTIHMRQMNSAFGFFLNGSLKVQPDPGYKDKLLRQRSDAVESCDINPCINEGKCLTNGSQKFCQCSGHFTGICIQGLSNSTTQPFYSEML